MKYLVLLGLLVGCVESNRLDNSLRELQELREATKSLEFSTKELECTLSINQEELRKEYNRLALPKNIENAYLLIDATIFRCMKNKYKVQ